MDAKQAGMAATGAAEVGAGAGASAAEAPLTAESATNTTNILKLHHNQIYTVDLICIFAYVCLRLGRLNRYIALYFPAWEWDFGDCIIVRFGENLLLLNRWRQILRFCSIWIWIWISCSGGRGREEDEVCESVKESPLSGKSDGGGGAVVKKKITSRVVGDNNCSKDGPVPSPHRSTRDLGVSRSIANETRKSLSPEKEDRYYTTRGSGGFDDATKALFMDPREDNRKVVWPKLLIALSSKDFMAMKGCKPPQRPQVDPNHFIGEPGSLGEV
ncbi:uncharacterized protein LOC121786982 [Salvia splendens]|uniref:uncharacterized protein LOC121786982 n=1 Tax=Salvia splendens TaxID=180675 RepID=UPI001C2780F3|nr:uncharacterized protein LOC121786982 [Salvia splendens]